MKEAVDFNHIEAKHLAIHERLRNWSRYVSVKKSPWFVQPMFKHAKTPRQWDIEPHIHIPVDTLDGNDMEKAVQRLPMQEREAVRWWYVRKNSATDQRKVMGFTSEALYQAVRNGRQMLINTTGKPLDTIHKSVLVCS